MISDVVWTACQTNGAHLQPGSEEPYVFIRKDFITMKKKLQEQE